MNMDYEYMKDMIRDYLRYNNMFVVIKEFKMDGTNCIVTHNEGTHTISIWDLFITINDRLGELESKI